MRHRWRRSWCSFSHPEPALPECDRLVQTRPFKHLAKIWTTSAHKSLRTVSGFHASTFSYAQCLTPMQDWEADRHLCNFFGCEAFMCTRSTRKLYFRRKTKICANFGKLTKAKTQEICELCRRSIETGRKVETTETIEHPHWQKHTDEDNATTQEEEQSTEKDR